MSFRLHNKLIQEVGSPKGLLYRMIISYALITSVVIVFLAGFMADNLNINIYFIINFLTIFLLTWFIRKSFNILSQDKHLATFRIGLFLLLNSALASMAGGLKVIDRDITSLIAALLYAPAILLFLFSFNRFIYFVNERYKSAVGLSLTDELTHLPNRRHMNMKLRETEQTTGVFCIMDIDDFKRINDTYGHDMGDRVLKQTGSILRNYINESTFIARSGGEEFSVILTGEIELKEIIEEIKHALAVISIENNPVTFSLGVSEKKEHQTTSSALAAADAALYESKRNGKNQITYHTGKAKE